MLPPENRTSDEIYNSICTTVEELFSFTLSLLGEYDVLTGGEGDRVSWSGYMKRLSSEDPTRQAYVNMAEFVYVIKTVEAIKRWEDNSILPGLDHYQNGYQPGYVGTSALLVHAEEEQKFINSIFNAYYNDEFKAK